MEGEVRSAVRESRRSGGLRNAVVLNGVACRMGRTRMGRRWMEATSVEIRASATKKTKGRNGPAWYWERPEEEDVEPTSEEEGEGRYH